MSETKRNGWKAGYGNGLTGPTTPNLAGPVVGGKKWGVGIVSRGAETIAICPNQATFGGAEILGSGEEHARLIAAAPDLLTLAYQYRDDLRHPPAPDSRERRLEAIEAAIRKAEGSLT